MRFSYFYSFYQLILAVLFFSIFDSTDLLFTLNQSILNSELIKKIVKIKNAALPDKQKQISTGAVQNVNNVAPILVVHCSGEQKAHPPNFQ